MPVRRIRSDSEEEEEDRANFNSSTVANKRATYANADDDSDTKEAQQPRPSKRAKITSNDNAEASSDEVDDQEEETDGMDVENIPRHSIIDDPPKPLEFGDDGYVEGSIVKMILVNFVTYDYCEIFPGPQMNMIIGPNGTGKSTIVCAIALGLGGSPNLLGRAKNVAEFVKTGQDEAQITIELKRVNSRNVILQRTLRKSNNATSWRLNGKQATQKEVFSLIQSFNIQVDNLCQFLPQDRVAEFAELSPPQLLQRTQIAAGKFDLADMQKQLMEWRNEEKQLSRTNSSDIDHLKTLKTRNSELEKDVVRMQQRKQLEDEIKLLKAQLPLVRYTESKRRSEELKKIYETEKEKVRQAKAKVAPIQNFLRQSEQAMMEATAERNDTVKQFKNATLKVKEVNEKINSKRMEISTKRKEIIHQQTKLAQRQGEIERAETNIRFLENQLQNKPNGDTTKIDEKIAEINSEMNELYEKSDDIEAASEKHQSALKNVQRDFESKRHQLEELKNIQKTRLRKLQRDYPDTVKLHEYIDENKDQFEGRVYGPVVLMMNLKDARYAALVEQAMGGPRSFIFRAFICEKQSDYKKLTAYAIDKQQWKVRIQWSPTNEGDSRTPISTEELRSRFKLDYFVSDLIECPTIVHRALCQDSNINLIPVALQGVNPAQIASSGIFRKFVVGQTFYNVKTSNYGKRSKQITTSAIRNEYWLGESIDLDAKNALLESLKQLQSNKHDLDVQLEKLGSKLDQIKRELEQKKDEKKVLQNEKREIQIAEQRYNKNRDRLVRLKHDLEELRQKPEEDKRKIDELEREIKQMNEHEESLLAECEECLGKVIDYHKTMILASINYLHCSTKHTSVKQFAKQHSKDLEAAEREMNNIKVHYANANNDVKRHMQHCRDAGQGLPDELTEKWKEIVQIWKAEGLPITLEDLENKIAVQQGKKDGMRFANPHAMEHYEERKKEIQRLEEKIDKNKQVLDELKAKIDGLKNQWAPMIHSLVERINEKFTAAFQRIRCVGAVSVAEDPDFDKWGINIHVKFRENEKLQLLTGQRQSGGERSVTTILYLMSLQDLAKSPFRVVDEINQGMDPRNERMIHEQIVKGASRPGTSQYFLITPKLLPDLYYNERMRVLCIYNGEWLPDKMKPLSHYLENARQIAQA